MQMWFRERSSLLRPIFLLVRFPLAIYQLIRLIQRKHIDIVNIHYPVDYGVFFAVCRRIISFCLVTSVHAAGGQNRMFASQLPGATAWCHVYKRPVSQVDKWRATADGGRLEGNVDSRKKRGFHR